MINIKDFDSNLLKIDKSSYGNIDIYYIRYITMKDSDYIKTNSVNLLYLILNKVGGSIKESNGNKCLIFADTDKNKELLKKYTKPWHEIKYDIKTINAGKYGEYGKDYVKINIQFK